VSLRHSANLTGKVTALQKELNECEDIINQLKREKQRLSVDSARVNREYLETQSVSERVKLQKEAESRTNSAKSVIRGNIDIIHSAHREGEEAVQIGSNTLVNLNDQSNKLFGISEGLRNLDGKITEARQQLNTLWANMSKAQVVRLVTIMVLIIACLLVVYFKFLYEPITPSPAPIPVTPTPTPSPSNSTTVR